MRLSVLGAGPHGRELVHLLATTGRIDPVLYDDNLLHFPATYEAPSDAPYVIGAVWPHVRRQIAEKAHRLAPWRGDGRMWFPGVRIGHGVTWGAQCHALHNAVISHGCRLGDFVTVCAGAVLAGEVQVGDDVTIGANATVLHGGLTIGNGAFVGAGAVVTDDVPPGATVVGAPAREVQRVPL